MAEAASTTQILGVDPLSSRLPNASVRDVIRAFERGGFHVVPGRGKGSHITMARDDWPAILVIPSHGDVPRGTLRALIRQSGMTVEQFVALL